MEKEFPWFYILMNYDELCIYIYLVYIHIIIFHQQNINGLRSNIFITKIFDSFCKSIFVFFNHFSNLNCIEILR